MILEKSGDGWWRGQYGNKVREQIQNKNLTLTSSFPGGVVPVKLHPGGDRWPPHLLHGRERSRRHGTIPYSPFGSYKAKNIPPQMVWILPHQVYQRVYKQKNIPPLSLPQSWQREEFYPCRRTLKIRLFPVQFREAIPREKCSFFEHLTFEHLIKRPTPIS